MDEVVFDKISSEILNEVKYAERKHPVFPTDVIYKAALLGEESGEACREANLMRMENKGSVENFKKEVIQTACICYRILASMEENNNECK